MSLGAPATGLPAKMIKTINDLGQIYEVGGAVRDRIRHSLSLDAVALDPAKFWSYRAEEVDYLVTGLPLHSLFKILHGYGQVQLVGKSFGVLKFRLELPESGPRLVDIALPRRETSTGPGHRDFEIEYDPGIRVEEDLARRDFTINAIALPIKAPGKESHIHEIELIDPFGGLRDIKDRLIRMVNPDAFREDPLRMLRACQFAARFQFSMERDTFRAIKKHSGLIKTVSAERIQQEINKLLTKSDQPSIGLWLMQRSGLLKEILPELEAGVDVTQPGNYHRYKVFEHCIRTADFVSPTLEIRLAALLHDIAKPQCREAFAGGVHFYGHDKLGQEAARRVLERLRYSGGIVDRVSRLVRNHMFAYPETQKGLRRLIARVGLEGLNQLMELRLADIRAQGRCTEQAGRDLEVFRQAVAEVLGQTPPFSLADLQVDGRDLMKELGLNPGPRVGRVLRHLMEYVLEYPKRNQREELLTEASRWMAKSRQGFYP